MHLNLIISGFLCKNLYKLHSFKIKTKFTGSFWDPQSSQTLVLGTSSHPVTKMVPVGGKLWCGSQNTVLIINTTTLEREVGGGGGDVLGRGLGEGAGFRR